MGLVGLIDTNIISALMRDTTGALWKRARAAGPDAYCTSIIVAAELRFGAERVQSPRIKRQIEDVLSEITVFAFEPPADRHYASLRSHIERLGKPIGPHDMLIAAHALALDLTLITSNIGEFSRVPGLRVENWLD